MMTCRCRSALRQIKPSERNGPGIARRSGRTGGNADLRRRYSLTCLSAAAAAKGASAIAASEIAHSIRNGVRNGAAPPLAAEAAETPKISTGNRQRQHQHRHQ